MQIGTQGATEEWFEVHTRYGSCEVALNPSSREFNEMLRKLEAPYARYKRKHDGELPPGAAEKIARQCIAETVLLDWRGMDGPDGEPLPFTKENAIAAMEDEVIGDRFAAGVLDAARSLWESFAVEVEDAEKN